MQFRIRSSPVAMMAADARLSVRLDGELVYEGSFVNGFCVEQDVAPGDHILETQLSGFGRRPRRFEVSVEDGVPEGYVLEAELRYSRFWGNFDKELRVSRAELSAWDPASDPAPEAAFKPAKTRATWALLAILVACFAVEVALGFGEGATPSVDTLVGLGGLLPTAMAQGEWFRIISCTFLHADVPHLLCNAVALVLAGVVVEGIMGPRWFLAAYFIGALGGSAFSLALNPGDIVSVGASGAIMGVFATGLFVAQRLPTGQRGLVQFQMLRVLIPSLIPLLPRGGERVDIGAHLGGAVAGALLGALLLLLMRRADRSHGGFEGLRAAKVPLVIAGAFGLSALVSFAAVASATYPEAQRDAHLLLPDRLLPDSPPDAHVLHAWLEQHPEDPRVRIFVADEAVVAEDFDGAAGHIAEGRAALRAHADRFPPASRNQIAKAFDSLTHEIALRRELVPNREWNEIMDVPQVEGLWPRLDGWLLRFPSDPRLHRAAAWRAFVEKDAPAVIQHAETVRRQQPRFASVLPQTDAEEGEVDVLKGAALLDLDRAADAEAVLAPYCQRDEPPDDVDVARLVTAACRALGGGDDVVHESESG